MFFSVKLKDKLQFKIITVTNSNNNILEGEHHPLK